MHEWQKEFKLRDNLLQRDVYAFESALHDAGGLQFDSASVTSAHALKAAIAAGWIESPVCEKGMFEGKPRWFVGSVNLDELHAGKVRWYGTAVLTAYNAAVDIPKN